MRRMIQGKLGLLALSGLLIGACASSSSRQLRMNQLDGQIAGVGGLPDDPLAREKVEVLQTGKPDYDRFFSDAGEVHGGLIVSKALAEALQKNTIGAASAYASQNPDDPQVKRALAGRSAATLDWDRALMVLSVQKAKGALSVETAKFAARGAVDAAQTANYLGKTTAKASSLLPTGQTLASRAKDDFTGMEARHLPGVTSGLNQSVDHLRAASSEAPALAKQLQAISQGLGSLAQ